MRIAVATWHAQIRGGAEQYLRRLLPALRERGHDVGLLVEQAAAGPESVAADLPDAPLWTTGAGSTSALEALRAWRPDVVYAHGLTDPGTEARLVDSYPAVLFAHGYYGTCATGTKRHAFPGWQACKRTFGPACLLLHYPRRCGGLSPARALRDYALQSRRNSLLSRYRAILVASRHMHSELSRHVGEGRVRLLPLPLTASRHAVPPAERPLSGRLLLSGRLTADKGVRIAVRAVAIAQRSLGRPLSLILAGAGSEAEPAAALGRDLGVPVSLAGWVGRERLATLMSDADLIVVASLWPEPFGLVGIEAAAVGTPAVAFDVGGIRDWLEPGVTGELAPTEPPTAEGLAAAIARALRDPAHHAALCRGAWEAAGRFGMDRHLTGLLAVLQEAAGSAGSSGPGAG